jgi:hypothetical protein
MTHYSLAHLRQVYVAETVHVCSVERRCWMHRRCLGVLCSSSCVGERRTSVVMMQGPIVPRRRSPYAKTGITLPCHRADELILAQLTNEPPNARTLRWRTPAPSAGPSAQDSRSSIRVRAAGNPLGTRCLSIGERPARRRLEGSSQRTAMLPAIAVSLSPRRRTA